MSYYTFCILYQVYYTLNSLKKIFTHYDLHYNNIMYIKLPKIIKIIYEDVPNTVILYTRFIPIIIDYGRCHINCLALDNNIFSRIFLEIACETDKCNNLSYPNCNTLSKGILIKRQNLFNYLQNFENTNIIPYIKNESHDLRYLVTLMINKIPDNRTIKKNFLLYANPAFFAKNYYGTIENDDGIIKSLSLHGTIKTLNDIMVWLTYIYNANIDTDKSTDDIYGTMKIYKDIKENKPWTFEKA